MRVAAERVQGDFCLYLCQDLAGRPEPTSQTSAGQRFSVEMKQRNPNWGCPRIAEQINLAFGTAINFY
jgi:hypothetical protein